MIKILVGWWFWITNRNNELSRKRLKVCSTCPYRIWFTCGECGCPLQPKSRLPEDEECPKGFWE